VCDFARHVGSTASRDALPALGHAVQSATGPQCVQQGLYTTHFMHECVLRQLLFFFSLSLPHALHVGFALRLSAAQSCMLGPW